MARSHGSRTGRGTDPHSRSDLWGPETGDISENFEKTMNCNQHSFNCRPSHSIVSEDAEIEPRTVATSALAVRRSSTKLDLIHISEN